MSSRNVSKMKRRGRKPIVVATSKWSVSSFKPEPQPRDKDEEVVVEQPSNQVELRHRDDPEPGSSNRGASPIIDSAWKQVILNLAASLERPSTTTSPADNWSEWQQEEFRMELLSQPYDQYGTETMAEYFTRVINQLNTLKKLPTPSEPYLVWDVMRLFPEQVQRKWRAERMAKGAITWTILGTLDFLEVESILQPPEGRKVEWDRREEEQGVMTRDDSAPQAFNPFSIPPPGYGVGSSSEREVAVSAQWSRSAVLDGPSVVYSESCSYLR